MVITQSKWLLGVALLPFVATIIFGAFAYPEAPIVQRGAVFTDKVGRLYTAEQFQHFERWERTLAFTGGAWAFLCVAAAVQHYRRTGSLRRAAPPKRPSHSPTA